MSESYYYWQIGGWRSHVIPRQGNIPRDPVEIADRLFRYASEDGVLTLKLGILPNGASYLLLLDDEEVHPDVKSMFRNRGYQQSRFISLSPVTFTVPGSLVAKLNKHAQKYRKKKGNQPDCDRSTANTHYTSSGQPLEVLTANGLHRASFEYHRAFYRLCRGSIDPSEHGIQRVSWLDNIRARSFSYNLHSAGQYRPKEERRKNPMVLDVGLAEWILPGGSIDLTVERSDSFTLKNILTNPNKGSYLFGDAREVTEADITARLKESFKREDDAPIVLFVQDAEEALDVLSYYGINTSGWTTHFEPVVGRPVLSIGERYSERPAYKREQDRYSMERGRRDNYYGNQASRSGRSRSPERKSDPYKRERSPLRRDDCAVYVVDVPELYETMRSIPPTRESPLDIARFLDVRLPDANGNPLPNNGTGWCAGNECRLLAYIWRALVEGNALEEQEAYLTSRPKGAAPQVAEQVPADQGSVPPIDDDDDDVDPSNIPAAQPAASSAQAYTDPYGSGDEDYETW